VATFAEGLEAVLVAGGRLVLRQGQPADPAELAWGAGVFLPAKPGLGLRHGSAFGPSPGAAIVAALAQAQSPRPAVAAIGSIEGLDD
jgi:hypothetical protein